MFQGCLCHFIFYFLLPLLLWSLLFWAAAKVQRPCIFLPKFEGQTQQQHPRHPTVILHLMLFSYSISSFLSNSSQVDDDYLVRGSEIEWKQVEAMINLWSRRDDRNSNRKLDMRDTSSLWYLSSQECQRRRQQHTFVQTVVDTQTWGAQLLPKSINDIQLRENDRLRSIFVS